MNAQSPTSRGPLEGVRVLEFTTAWAGPYAGRCLAFLGADVIKVEAPSHPDSWRGSRSGGAPRFYPQPGVAGPAYDSNLLFNSQNIDKRSLALDLKVPGALPIFEKLVACSDVILANFTPGVLDRLGIGYSAMSRVNPRIIVAEMPAFGPGGPLSAHQGMGKTMEPATGMTSLMSYPDGEPVLTGPALMDPVGGLNTVAAIVSALELRERSGQGSRILVAQVEAAAHWIGEFVLAAVDGTDATPPGGNAVHWAAPHDAYRCRGDDEWVAIAVTASTDWRALATVLGLSPDDVQRFDALDARLAAGPDRLRHLLEPLTSNFDKHDLADRLQQVGVAAAPVMKGDEVATDPGLRERGLVVSLDHPRVGPREYASLAFQLDRTPGSHRSAAPLFGEHNDQVLQELLGLDAAELAELRGAGIIADATTADTDTPTATRPADIPSSTTTIGAN